MGRRSDPDLHTAREGSVSRPRLLSRWRMGHCGHQYLRRILLGGRRREDAIVVSVGYRLAPENKFAAAPNDAYAALRWTQANATSFNGDADRISVGGESASEN